MVRVGVYSVRNEFFAYIRNVGMDVFNSLPNVKVTMLCPFTYNALVVNVY